MNKSTKSAKKLFSLSSHFGGAVKQVGLVIKDISVGSEGDGAMVFLTFKLADSDIEAQMPLSDNKEFKNHIVAIIDQAIELKRAKEAGVEKKVKRVKTK